MDCIPLKSENPAVVDAQRTHSGYDWRQRVRTRSIWVENRTPTIFTRMLVDRARAHSVGDENNQIYININIYCIIVWRVTKRLLHIRWNVPFPLFSRFVSIPLLLLLLFCVCVCVCVYFVLTKPPVKTRARFVSATRGCKPGREISSRNFVKFRETFFIIMHHKRL